MSCLSDINVHKISDRYSLQHNNPVCRRLHLVGTGVSFAILTRVLLSGLPKLAASPSAPLALQRMLPDLRPLELAQPAWKYIAGGLFQNYFVAWVGHFFFEHNKPATFKYPLYSFIGDVRMFFEVILGRRKP